MSDLAGVRLWPRQVLTPAAWASGAGLDAALLALWADTVQAHALLLDQAAGPLAVSVPLAEGAYPALSPRHPGAAWFERMVRDLWGHEATGGTDRRRWLDHGRWEVERPMAPRPPPRQGSTEPPELLPPAAETLHQLPLGPARAGLHAPAHLRLTCRGETVVRLEARLGYAHKGQLVLMRGKPPRLAARYAARLSAAATVAHSLAFARAAEAALQTPPPPRAVWLRAVMAEIERIAGNLADIAAVLAAAGAAASADLAGRFCEVMRRAAQAAFGHRLMMDCVVPGGVAVDIAAGGGASILAALQAVDVAALARGAATAGARLAGVGRVSLPLVRALAAGGPAGRAAGWRFDARLLPGSAPYESLGLQVPVDRAGDAAARLRMRLADITESARLLPALLQAMPSGPTSIALPVGSGEGIGVAEAPGGDAWHWLRLDGGLVASVFPRDPGWALWPLLEAACAGAALGDVGLIAASFAPSVSAVDL
jgi:Ni,Fe-hydrogenase III large subunit